MTTLEVKDEILMLLAQEKNITRLERIRAFVAATVFENEAIEEIDWWDELPNAQQQRLLAILHEVRQGQNLVSNEAVWEKLKRWSS